MAADSIDTRTMLGGVLNVLGSVAQWERETISERTTEAMAHKRARGQRTSLSAPYGYRLAADDNTLVADEAEQALLAAIREAVSGVVPAGHCGGPGAAGLHHTQEDSPQPSASAAHHAAGKDSLGGHAMADNNNELEARRWFRRLAEMYSTQSCKSQRGNNASHRH